jgi:hypothetical protein
MSINNTVSSHILTYGSTKDTSHIDHLESRQKELQDKVALLEEQASSHCPQRKCLLTMQQLRENDKQLRDNVKQSRQTEDYVKHIEDQLEKQNQCEETLQLNLQSKTERVLEAEEKLAESIVVVQQLRTELKLRSKKVQQQEVKLAEKDEIVAKLRASLKEVLDRNYRPVTHNTGRKEDQRAADAQPDYHGETETNSDLSDIGGSDSGSEASTRKVRTLAEELAGIGDSEDDTDHEDGNDSRHDLEVLRDASKADETQCASVPVDPDDPQNRKASIQYTYKNIKTKTLEPVDGRDLLGDEGVGTVPNKEIDCSKKKKTETVEPVMSDVLSRGDSISAPNNTRKSHNQHKTHTSLHRSGVGNTDTEPEVLVPEVLKPAEKLVVFYGSQDEAGYRNGNKHTLDVATSLQTSERGATQRTPPPIEQGRRESRISIQEHRSDASTKTKSNTLELVKSDTPNGDGDSTSALSDTGEVHGQVEAETRPGDPSEGRLDFGWPEVDGVAHELTTDINSNVLEELTGALNPGGSADHGNGNENNRVVEVYEQEVVAFSYAPGPQEAQHDSTSSEQDQRGTIKASIEVHSSHAHTTTNTRASKPAETGVSALPTIAENLAGLSRPKEDASTDMFRHASAPENEETHRALILTKQGESHMSLNGPEVDSANAELEVLASENLKPTEKFEQGGQGKRRASIGEYSRALVEDSSYAYKIQKPEGVGTRSDDPVEIARSDDHDEMDVDEKNKAQYDSPLVEKDRPRKRHAFNQLNADKKRARRQTMESINPEDMDREYDSLSALSDPEEDDYGITVGINPIDAESGVSALLTAAENVAGVANSEEDTDAEVLRPASTPESEETQRALTLTKEGESHMSLDGPEVDCPKAEPEVSLSELGDLREESMGVDGARDDTDGYNGKDNSRGFGVYRIASGEETQRTLKPRGNKGKAPTRRIHGFPNNIQKVHKAEPSKLPLARLRPRTEVQRLKDDHTRLSPCKPASARSWPFQVSEAQPEVGNSHEGQREDTSFLGNDVVMRGTGSVTAKVTVYHDTINMETPEPVESDVQGRDCNSRPASYETGDVDSSKRVDTLPDGHNEVAVWKRLEPDRTDAESVEMADSRDSVRDENYSNVNDYMANFGRALDRAETQRALAAIDQGDGRNCKVLIRLDGSNDYTETETETLEPTYEPELAGVISDKETGYNKYDEQML